MVAFNGFSRAAKNVVFKFAKSRRPTGLKFERNEWVILESRNAASEPVLFDGHEQKAISVYYLDKRRRNHLMQ